MFLSDFRPGEEYYVLLNDSESSTIKRFGKNAQIEYKNITREDTEISQICFSTEILVIGRVLLFVHQPIHVF